MNKPILPLMQYYFWIFIKWIFLSTIILRFYHHIFYHVLYLYVSVVSINLTGHIWRIHSMSKRFLHISDGWNNWWRYTRRTTLKKKCNYKVDVMINYLYRLVYWSWHKMSLPTTGFLELTLVPRTLAGFFLLK